jgi:hypothetical protein
VVGQPIEAEISLPNTIAKVTRYVIRRAQVPNPRSMCLPLGSTTAQKRC